MTRVIKIPYTPREVFIPIHRAFDSHRFCCLVAHRRMGKSVGNGNQLIKRAVQNPLHNPQYAFVAPQLKQAKLIIWRYLKDFARPLPRFKANEAELFVEFQAINGTARIYVCGADNPDTLRGAYWDGVILDEFAQMKPEMWDEIILPSISDRAGWVVISGTPKGMNHFYEIYQDFLKRFKENPNGQYWAGLFEVYSTNVFKPDQIQLLRDSMSEIKFRQEYLCDWSASNEDILIPINLVENAMNSGEHDWDVYKDSPRVLGVDVARFGDDRSVLFPRQGLQAFSPVVFENIDNMSLASQVASVVDRYNIKTVFIDSGRGEGVIDRLRQLGYNNVIEVKFGGSPPQAGYLNMRAFMWDSIKKWLERGGRLPKDHSLLTELSTPTYSINLQDKMVLESKKDIKERVGRSTDIGDALALTFAFPVVSDEILEKRGQLKRGGNSYISFDPITMGFSGR